MISSVSNKVAATKRSISSSPKGIFDTGFDDGHGDSTHVCKPQRNHFVDKSLRLLDENEKTSHEQCLAVEGSSGQPFAKRATTIGDVDAHQHFQKQKIVKVLPCISPTLDEVTSDKVVHKKKTEETPVRKGHTKKKKKKRKLKTLSICTANCKYEVVRRVAARFGMREVSESYSWNLYWTDLSVSVERAKEMKRFQKINHFPGMNEICRKDLLARNLNRMLKLFPKDYNFFPMTWCLPSDHGDFTNYARTKRNKAYICKPDTGCQGRGIYVTKSIKDVKPYDRMICQVYLQKPLLLDGYKFDLRVYTLITSCDPLRVFVYNEGLARFATSLYKEPTTTNSSNVFMHLTNYAVNKHSRTFKVDDEGGSKRKISALNKVLLTKGINVKELWSRIDDIIVKTVIAAHPALKHSYGACFPSHDFTYACFELLGFDILIDHKLKPFLLEVNHSPSFHTELPIDREIKEGLLMDTFEILNLSQTDKKKIIEEDRRRVRERLLQGINYKESTDIAEEILNRTEKQIEWEDKHMGNFRCIYPQEDSEKYDVYFNQNASSLFQETAASRARGECSRIHRLEMMTKAANEAAKRSASRPREAEKLRPESSSSKDGLKNKTASLPLRKKPLLPIRNNMLAELQKCSTANVPDLNTWREVVTFLQVIHMNPPLLDLGGFVVLNRQLLQSTRRLKNDAKDYKSLYSFDPEVINDEDEKERKTGLAQREFLIKSYGVTEQIYIGMMKNGTLRDADRKKYSSFERLNYMNLSNPATPHHSKLPAIPVSNDKMTLRTTTSCIPSTGYSVAELTPTCNNVPIMMRPAVPHSIWHNDLQTRGTKTQEARSFSNAVKLQGLEKREHNHIFNNA